MEPFTTLDSIVAPLDRSNVDTDAIIPKQYLKSIQRTGFGPNLFDEWRYLDHGEPGMDHSRRPLNQEFVLNQPRYQDAQILLTRTNFGCGSSREHAVWALLDAGYRAVIAPSFADIFYNNCFKNGLLPITLDEETVQRLFEAVDAAPGYALHIDLQRQEIRTPEQQVIHFDIDGYRKHRLLHGLDDIALTLQHRDRIAAFEAQHRRRNPWLFNADREAQ